MQPLDLREMARLAAEAVQSVMTERRHELATRDFPICRYRSTATPTASSR